jgi:enterochelin esterase-like enzyme
MRNNRIDPQTLFSYFGSYILAERVPLIAAIQSLVRNVGALNPDHESGRLGVRASRAISGLSMGGGQSEWVAFHNPELFGWVKLMSAAHENTPGAGINIPPPPNAADLRQPGITSSVDVDKFFAALPKLTPETVKQFRLFELAIGNHDGLLTLHRTVTGAMKARGIPVTAVEVDGYIHEWVFWRTALADLVPKLFQATSSK